MADVDEFTDGVPKHIAANVKQWLEWRAKNPVRGNEGAPVYTFVVVTRRPAQGAQMPWLGYALKKGNRQEWLYAPFLMDRDKQHTQPLAGAPAEAELMQVTRRGKPVVHYTNIHRMKHLASTHPLVSSLTEHKADKAADHSVFDKVGRATKNHQSPFDLKLTLAASGAQMYVGFTVKSVQKDLASMWWAPGKGLQNGSEFAKARAIFYDIAEAAHQQPNLGEGWRAAWARRGHVNTPPTRQAAGAASSPRPATRHPASGGEGSSPPRPPTHPPPTVVCGHRGVAKGVGQELKIAGCEHCPPAPEGAPTTSKDVEQRQRDAQASSAAAAASSGTSNEERGRRSASTAASGATEGRQGKDASPSPRRRRRSRSQSARRRSKSSSSDSDEGSSNHVDVTHSVWTRRGIEKLPEDAKEELRQVRRISETQKKFSGFQWQAKGSDPASGGRAVSMIPGVEAARLDREKTSVWSQLPGYAQPMPAADDFISGIYYYSDKGDQQGILLPVYQAIASTKMHCLTHLKKHLDKKGQDPGWLFDHLWPDTSPASGGSHPISADLCKSKADLGKGHVKDNADFLEHILTKHDGEAKIIIDLGYEPLPRGVDFHDARFWHYQYARTKAVRDWLYHRWLRLDASPLSDRDIQWMLAREENRTLLLRWVPPRQKGQLQIGARRLEEGDWEIRKGNYITLGELFKFGAKQVTCYHLYQMYLGLDFYIHRRCHSNSTTENATKRPNAEAVRFKETGHWGPPHPEGSWNTSKKRR